MIKGTKGSKAYEKSEDPIYALENNCPIDYNYYIENQIKLPLIRIFDPIFGNETAAEK
jgi:DNA polymerase delta subunit 1